VVSALYKALSSKDFDEVQRLLAPDIEWWFHGPPNRQHLMRLLTGSSPSSPKDSFHFLPQSFFAFGSTVLAEGYDKESSVSWVHAWTVADGIVTQLREYLNTSLTVTHFGLSQPTSSPAVASSLSSSANKCQSVWQSQLSDKSAPGLVLAL
jgi:ketosteroid isomerase-like protein